MAGRATAPFIVDQHLYTGTIGRQRRAGRGVRRSGRLQQRHRTGRRAHPVVAGNPIVRSADYLSEVRRQGSRRRDRCPRCRAHLVVARSGARAAERAERWLVPRRSSSACLRLLLALCSWVSRTGARAGRPGCRSAVRPATTRRADRRGTDRRLRCSAAIGRFSIRRARVLRRTRPGTITPRSRSFRPPSRRTRRMPTR